MGLILPKDVASGTVIWNQLN